MKSFLVLLPRSFEIVRFFLLVGFPSRALLFFQFHSVRRGKFHFSIDSLGVNDEPKMIGERSTNKTKEYWESSHEASDPIYLTVPCDLIDCQEKALFSFIQSCEDLSHFHFLPAENGLRGPDGIRAILHERRFLVSRTVS